MWERLQRFSRLDWEARGVFFRATMLLPIIRLSLRIRGFRATHESLRKFSFFAQAPERFPANFDVGTHTSLTVRMVNAAARQGWGRPTCLEKSLALWWLLRQAGVASSVRIGARVIGGKFAAHAWVECNGAVLNEPGEEHRHYATFDAAFPLQTPEIP
jgi:hypothetical protein